MADAQGHDIQRLDASGNPLATWFTGALTFPSSVTPGAGGVYVTVSPGNLRLYGPGGSLLDELATPVSGGQLSTPFGSATDADGNIYVAERINDRVKKFDPAGNLLTVFGSSGSGDGQLDAPFDVAVDSARNVYVVERGTNRVQKFDAAGNFLLKWDRPAAATGSSRIRPASPWTRRAISSSQTPPTTGSRSSMGRATSCPSGARTVTAPVSSTGRTACRWTRPAPSSSPTRATTGSSGSAAPLPARARVPRVAGAGGSPRADTAAARVRLSGRSLQRVRRVRRRGLALRITTNEPVTVSFRATLSRRVARRIGLRRTSIGRATVDLGSAGSRALRLRLTARARRAMLRIGSRKPRIVVRASAADRAGNRSGASVVVAVKR